MGLGGHNIGVIASSRESDELWTNLVSWWKMTETSGDALDSHGSDDGTVTGVTQTSGGLVFDGTDDDVAISPDAFGTGNFTIIMRVTPTDTPGTMEQLWGGVANSLLIRIYEARVIYVEIEGGSSVFPITVLDEDVENFVAIVRDSIDDSITFYINDNAGELETLSANFSASSTTIGIDTSGGSWADFTGTLSNLCYFTDAKSAAYIEAFYNSGSYTDYEDGDPI